MRRRPKPDGTGSSIPGLWGRRATGAPFFSFPALSLFEIAVQAPSEMIAIAFHTLNYALAALFYTLLGRGVFNVLVLPERESFVRRLLHRATDPVLRAVRHITPAVVPHPLLLLLAAVWVLALRAVLAATALVSGLVTVPQ